MPNDLKRYLEYKDSGTRWIGEVPEGWEVKRLKYLDKCVMGQSPDSDKYDKDGVGIPFLQGNADFMAINPVPSVWCGETNKLAKKDDVLLSVRAPVGAVNIADQVYGIGRGLCAIRAKQSHKRYLYFKVLCLSEELNSIATGSTYTAVSVEQVRNVLLPYPAYDEQESIADYLDRKTVQIDALIAKKERMIELLKEERTVIINQAVTKGLEPNVEMKDSGVEWLGRIPKHWGIKKLKYLLRDSKGDLKTGPFGSQLKHSDMQGGNIKVYNQRSVLDNDFDSGDLFISDEKFSELKEFEIFSGDMLLTTRGTIGKCAVFPDGKNRGILHPCLIRIQFDSGKISNRYARYYMQDSSLFFESVKYNSNATTIDVIYGDTLRDVTFVIPPRKEQNKIADHIEKQSNEIDEMTNRVLNQTTLLKEYRTALISEVVTGKIDVRGVVNG